MLPLILEQPDVAREFVGGVRSPLPKNDDTLVIFDYVNIINFL
jgi:hypothetical protein